MSSLPDTTTGKRGRPHLPNPLLVAACSAALLVAVALSLGQRGFSPGEKLNAQGVEDVAASAEDTLYPGSDALRFDPGTPVVYVYLRVEDLDIERGLEARVERSNSTSVLAWLLPGEDLRALDEREDRLSAAEGGVSGVVSFAVRSGSGRPLPAGNYAVGVYPAGVDSGVPLAEKYFVVEE